MALEKKGFEWGNRNTTDDDTVDRFMHEGSVIPQAPSVGDLWSAIEWLATYACETVEESKQWANVIAFLMLTAESKEKRTAINTAKRNYAKEHGLKVSQVRIKKEAK